MSFRQQKICDGSRWFCGQHQNALAGKARDGKKGSLCGTHESCDTNIKAHSWIVIFLR